MRVLLAVSLVLVLAVPAGAASPRSADAALQRALNAMVKHSGGPHGAISVVQRGKRVVVLRAGVADRRTGRRPRSTDHMRIASVAKAFSGAAALALVARGKLRLDAPVRNRLHFLPRAWRTVTLRQLLGHRSGLPDLLESPDFIDSYVKAPQSEPSPRKVLSYTYGIKLRFSPGKRYEYANTDNFVVGLLVGQATGGTYERALRNLVLRPLRLTQTSLPRGARLPGPAIRGYDADGDVTNEAAAAWSWASGGIVSTPLELNRFIRYWAPRGSRFGFGPGGSEPTGPGRNSAGLGLFRYRTRCGTVYGHTGNTSGFTQIALATRDGKRSATLSINRQITQKNTAFEAVRPAFLAAACAALAR